MKPNITRRVALDIHFIPDVYLIIAFCSVCLIYAFVIMGLALVPVFGNRMFFRFKTPVIIEADPTKELLLTDDGILVGLLFLLALEQGMETIVKEIQTLTEEDSLVVESAEIITRYIRYATHIVFMRSQVSFFVAIVIFDALATIMSKRVSMKFKRQKLSMLFLNQKYSSLLTCCRCMSILVFMACYIYSGLFESAYVYVGVPLIVFDSNAVTTTSGYVIVIISVFIFAAISAAARNNIEKWQSSVLLNLSEEETGMKDWEVRLIIVNRIILLYLSLMFVYTFLTTQFFFVIVYLTADILMTIINKSRNQFKNENNLKDRSFTVVFINIIQTTLIGILVVVIVASSWFDYDYFRWGKDVYVFGTLVEKGPKFVLLLFYVAFERICMTAINLIVDADINTWMYDLNARNKDLDNYTDETIVWICTIVKIAKWFYFALRIQFILSNYSFVVVMAAVDIPTTLIINEFHISHKKNLGENIRIRKFLDEGSKKK